MPFVGSLVALVCYNLRPLGYKFIDSMLHEDHFILILEKFQYSSPMQPFQNQCLTPLHLLIASQVITSVQISAFLEGRTQQDSQQANFPLRPILGLVNIVKV